MTFLFVTNLQKRRDTDAGGGYGLPAHWVLSATLSASGCAKAITFVLVALLLYLIYY
jgi:hypothetical protein